MRRVVITGIGALTPLGVGREGLWAGVRSGRSAVRTITRFDASALKCRIAAEIDGFDPRDYMDGKSARRLDRFSQLAVAAARLALADARLEPTPSDGTEMGAYIGSALGGVAQAEAEHARMVREGLGAVDRLIALSVFNGAAASNLSIQFGLQGPALSNGNSCTSGTIAIGEAARLIQGGRVEAMLAGGAEAPLSPLSFGAFDLIGAMSRRNESPETASRPFDRDRDGFVMGEGAAVLVLEARDRAVRRGARIYGELLGYGVTSDGHHMTVPRPDGREAARSVRLALQEARTEPAEIDYINAHGSSTPLNDRAETLAIRQVFGDAAARVPVSSTKAMHAHALGASGAFEAAICLLAIEHGYIPPTVNLQQPDPDCDLDYVPRTGRPARLRKVLSQSFGFGGVNAALVFGADR